jgi:hypothetical protein
VDLTFTSKASDFDLHLYEQQLLSSFLLLINGSYGIAISRNGKCPPPAYALTKSPPTLLSTRSPSPRTLPCKSERILCGRDQTSVLPVYMLDRILNSWDAVFAECALGRTFTAPFKCRQQNRTMNNCMVTHATQAEQDAAREEWFATRLKRQREREAREERKKEQEKFHREWWGLPQEDREGEKGREVMKRAERVGGFPKRDEGQLSKDRHR